jgi:hypothetical protein
LTTSECADGLWGSASLQFIGHIFPNMKQKAKHYTPTPCTYYYHKPSLLKEYNAHKINKNNCNNSN